VVDPYLTPGTECLANRLGITDPVVLAAAEFKIVSVRDVQVARTSIPGGFGLAHLQAFHRFLFQDIYEWAGKTRTVDISKPGALFCHWRFVDDEAGAVLSDLEDEEYLLGLKREVFVHRLAHYYGELNARHPFREGNGRTLRAFLRQLGAAAGYQLDWSELSKAENIEACRIHLSTADTAMLVEVLEPVVSRLS
jgi:cell filamentation protein